MDYYPRTDNELLSMIQFYLHHNEFGNYSDLICDLHKALDERRNVRLAEMVTYPEKTNKIHINWKKYGF